MTSQRRCMDDDAVHGIAACDCLPHSGVRVPFHERAYSNIDCRLRAGSSGNDLKQRRGDEEDEEAGMGRTAGVLRQRRADNTR